MINTLLQSPVIYFNLFKAVEYRLALEKRGEMIVCNYNRNQLTS
uniref:Uncharacterized protein n=1 Tax=Rhizophora mucronata TaxID=61149 RepID=A0A2P2PDV1_RHIMU